MKKLLAMMLAVLCLTMTYCGNSKPIIPMWEFDTNTNVAQVKQKLSDERILGSEIDTMINKNRFTAFMSDKYEVEYLGVDWGMYIIGCINDTISMVGLTRSWTHNDGLTESKIDRLIDSLDSLYGKHRTKNPEGFGPFDDNTKNWDWVKDGVHTRLFVSSVNKANDVVGLEIYNGNPEEIEKRMINGIKLF